MIYRFADRALDTDRCEIRHGEEVRAVEPQVFDLLCYLIENRARIVSKDEIFESVWQGRLVSESTLSSRVKDARQAIGDSGRAQNLIRTIHKKGFRFVADVVVDAGSASGATEIAASPAPREHPSVAVLPFDDLSADRDQEHLADGLVQDVTMLLARVPGFFVIARNSTFAYKGRPVDVRTVARDLGVRYIVEGSVRAAGDRIRVAAELIEGATGTHLWADSFDRQRADLFAVQDEVAQGIVGALQPQLILAEAALARGQTPDSVDAWGYAAHAWVTLFGMGRADTDRAEPLARRAVDLDPDYGFGHAVLAQVLSWRSYNGWTEDWYADAKEAIVASERAMALARNDPNVVLSRGMALHYMGLFLKAHPVLRRAVELNPNAAMACSLLGHSHAILGEPAEGIPLIERAFRLSPRDPMAFLFHCHLSHGHFFSGRFEEARQHAETCLQLAPGSIEGHLYLAAALVRLDCEDAARREIARIETNSPTAALKHVFRPRTEGTLWGNYTDALRRAGLEP